MASTRQNDTRPSFSLVELLVVIIILGILATVVVFAVNGIDQNHRQISCTTTQSNDTSYTQECRIIDENN